MNDGSKPLANRKHERFVRLIALGEMTPSEAYRSSITTRGTAKTSNEESSKMMKKPEILARVAWFAKRVEERLEQEAESVVLTVVEKRKFLARVVRTAAGELTEDSDLCQEWSESVSEMGSSKKVKMPDKLKAIQIDNDLAGEGENAKLGTAVEALAKLMGVKRV
jgi:hypothetical protein